ncbi:hypothetical protein [Roseovarius marisflavi]|uniref:hypothetical protein n=1 Tax=Roseovarius marisflavi TaxID=1054996 RepID=UPI0014810C9C|nr:hypothetical protein [Roseovarius marisflavi]
MTASDASAIGIANCSRRHRSSPFLAFDDVMGVGLVDDPKDQIQVRLAVCASEWPRQGLAADAILMDLVDLKDVLWDIVEGPDNHTITGSQIVLVEGGLCHDYALLMIRSGRTAPRTKLSGTGRATGVIQAGKQASMTNKTARAWGRARWRLRRFLSAKDEASRRPTPAANSSVKVVNIYTSPLRILCIDAYFFTVFRLE